MGFDSSIPARILMILDLTECKISTEVDVDQDQIDNVSHVAQMPHLTKEKWVVIKAAESPSVLSSNVTDDHLLNPIMTRIKLDEDRIWLVPLSSLVEPCFVTYNYNYCDRQNENDKCENDSTAIVIKSMLKWSDLFIG